MRERERERDRERERERERERKRERESYINWTYGDFFYNPTNPRANNW